MPPLRRHLLAVALIAGAAACAHAPAAPPLPAVTWPEPPAAPALRLAALWSGATLKPAAQGTLRRLAGLVVGEAAPDVAPAPLVRPFGVAAGAGGVIYLADPDAQLVLRIAADGEVARLRCAATAWAAPMAVALGPEGALYVADAGLGEVLRLGPGSTCRSMAPGSFERPTGLLALADLLLVADPALHRVVAVPHDGGPARAWGAAEAGAPFHFPVSLAAAADGSVLLVDALNFRVARLAADGRWLGAFTAPAEAGGLPRPKGIAVDAAGRIYVSDVERDQVLRFGADGAFEVALGVSGEAPGHFTAPSGLAIADGRLYVADSQNQRIQVFEILGDRS